MRISSGPVTHNDLVDVAELQRVATNPADWSANHAAIIRGYYDLVSGIYAATWGTSQHFPVYQSGQSNAQAVRSTVERLADNGDFDASMSVLDVGCGIGGPAMIVAAYTGAHVTGVDLVGHRIEDARSAAAEAGPGVRATFAVGDMMDLPFETASFDAAYSFEAICHAPRKASAYAEIARVLKPGSVFTGHDWLRGDGATAEIEPILSCHSIPSLLTMDELASHLDAAGFDVRDAHDVAADGDLDRNWELIDQATSMTLPDDAPEVMHMMTRGGAAIARAARSGAFRIGYWKAYKR